MMDFQLASVAGVFSGFSNNKENVTSSSSTHSQMLCDTPSSSSPLVHSDSADSSSSSSADDLPTPKDSGSSPAARAGATVACSSSSTVSSTTKLRRTLIRFSKSYEPSCKSSPKHRYHPYPRPAAAVAGLALSSSPTLLDKRKTRAFLAAAGSRGNPKSILKQRVKPPSQPLSPRKTPPSSPRKSITSTSCILVQPTFSSLFAVPTAEKLAKITKDNALKRDHTLSFPDLQSYDSAVRKHHNASDGKTGGRMQPATASGPTSDVVMQQGATGLGASQMVENGRQEDEDMQGPENKQGSSTDADPRQHIISALYTLKHSLNHPAWAQPSTSTQDEADAFESSPADFEPRNLPSSSSSDSSSAVAGKWPLLREIESAYANIFTYAHAYIVSAHAAAGREQDTDNLDELFITLQACLLSCLIRDIHNALNPVPVPSTSTLANEETGSSSPLVSPAPTPSASDTQASRQALLERPGLASSSMNIQLGSSPRIPALANQAPFLNASSPALNAKNGGTPDGKPKKVGRSSAEMRRRRSEIVVAEAAIQAAGALFSCRRFTKHMEATKITEFLTLLAQIPSTPSLQTPKYRDLLSSMNWLIANQCLSSYPDTKSHIFTSSTSTTLTNSLLDSLKLHAGKNGEKARRTTSEAFRALRTLILANPENALPCFVQPLQKRSGTCSFIATYLHNLSRPLRDNAALLLATIAHGATSAWRDESEDGRVQQNKVQEAVSYDLYRHWSMSENELELQNLENALTLAATVAKPTGIHSRDVLTLQNQAGDFAFVRLVINSLPILLGRRFRKMERKGPHTWLRKALAVKTADNIDSVDTADAKHILAFLPVLYAWAGASKEMAAKASSASTTTVSASRKGDSTSASDSNNDTEEVWALGNKAVRVIVQNIEVIDFSKASSAQAENAYAATQLIVAYLYTFSGLIPTLPYPSKDEASHASVHLHRDLSKLWKTFVEAYLPRLFESSSPKIRQIGWETLLAILRQGEENVEDSAMKSFRLEKVVNGQMLARCKSQTAHPVALSEIYEDMVRPHEIPSWSIEWVYNERQQIMEFMKTSLESTFKSIKEEEYESLEWVRSEDGYRILPVAFSITFRAFLTTLRNATGMNSSQADPTDRSQALSKEVMQFCSKLAKDIKAPAALSADLGEKGAQYAVIQHLFELLEGCFGMAGKGSGEGSVVDIALEAVLPTVASEEITPVVRSAFCALMRRLLDSRAAISAESSTAVVDLMTKPSPNATKLVLWELVAAHLLSHLEAKKEDGTSVHNASLQFLGLLPRLLTTPSPAHIQQFDKVLAASSRLDPVAAWSTIQALAAELSEDQRTSFYSWSLKLLLPRLADLSGNLAFAEAVVGRLDEFNDVDSILADAFSHFKDQALPTLQILLPLLEKRLSITGAAPAGASTPLYSIVLDAFTRAYQVEEVKPDLTKFSTLFLAALHFGNDAGSVLPEAAKTFVTFWNKTYGTQEGSLDYPDALKDTLTSLKTLDLGIILPGWPEEPVAEEPEPVSEPEESMLEESFDQTLDLNMVVEQQQSQEAAFPTEPAVQQAPQVRVSMAETLEVTEELEETPEHVEEAMSQDLRAADALSPPPSLSQIPDIVPATATATAQDSGSTTTILETPQLPSEAFPAPQPQSQEASIDMIPETQRAPAAAAEEVDSQVSRLSESFVESQMPHNFPLLPDAVTGKKAVITKPPGYRPSAYSSMSLKDLKGKGKARGAISPIAEETAAAPARARRTASLSVSPSRASPKQALAVAADKAPEEASDKSADISRITASPSETSTGNASAVSAKAAAAKSKPLKKRKSIIEVVIPYRHDISREGSVYAGDTSRKAVSRKTKAATAGDTSKILEQMPSSSFPPRKISPLKKTASESLTLTRKPAVEARSSVKASSSLPIAGRDDDESVAEDAEEEDEFLLTSSSSPIRGADITDSFSVNRRRHGDIDNTVTSSPVCQAQKRKRERSNSNSQESHRLHTQSPQARITKDLQELVRTLSDLDEDIMRVILNRLPEERVELLHATSEKVLKERANKKKRSALSSN